MLPVVFTILAMLSVSVAQNTPCYSSCQQTQCDPNDLLACTGCYSGTALFGSSCIPVGESTDPMRILPALDQNTLRLDLNATENRIVQCQYDGKGNLTFLDVTVSKTDLYVLNPILVELKTDHEFINIRLNAILLNDNNPTPTIKILIIDDQKRNIFQQVLEASPSSPQSLNCVGSAGTRPSGKVFFIDIKIRSASKLVYIQVQSQTPGDEIGISNLLFYSGNCHPRCSSCNGLSQSDCLTCAGLLFDSTGICEICPQRFTIIDDFCYACPYNCLTCEYEAFSGKMKCLTCENITEGSPPTCSYNGSTHHSLNSLEFANDGWTSSVATSGLISKCGPYSLLGGIPNGVGGSTLSKQFTGFMAHMSIWIKFTVILIDQIPNNIYLLQTTVDGETFTEQIQIDQSIQKSNTCAGSDQQFARVVYIPMIKHQALSAKIQVKGFGSFFGIRDFTIGVNNLTDNEACEFADENGTCLQCQKGFDVSTNCTQCPEGSALTNNDFCTACSIFCKTCDFSSLTEPENACTSCDLPLYFEKSTGQCVDRDNQLYTTAISPYVSTIANNKWQFYPKIQSRGEDTCGALHMLGSEEIQYRTLSSKRTYANLPSHQGLSIHFFFYQIDDYESKDPNAADNTGNDPYSVKFKIDERVYNYNVSKSGFDICGNSSIDSKEKIILNYPNHVKNSVNFEILANNVKFGINLFLLFLDNCDECDNGVSQELEVMPVYSLDEDLSNNGMSAKILFNSPIKVITDIKDLYDITLREKESRRLLQESNETQGRGQREITDFTGAKLIQGRELRLFRTLFQSQFNKEAVAKVATPDRAFSVFKDEDVIKPLRIQEVIQPFPRYDDISKDDNLEQRLNIRNLENFFRGISILALFIGLISFLFGLSHLFDDLFILCQIIFVHIFIQSPWLAPTFKIPISGMQNVQFMAWLPEQARKEIENGIFSNEDYYQRSPIVYEQYWKDINFIRAIYHTLIFLVIMIVLYLIIRLARAIILPRLHQITGYKKKKSNIFEIHYFDLINRKFTYIDKVVRFTFFTVVWAANLQFINFSLLPESFMGGTRALTLIVFIVFIGYVIAGQVYLWKQTTSLNETTFMNKHIGIRIKKSRILYFSFKYFKLLYIAIFISQMYKVNPLGALIPLLVIHLADGIIVLILKPYIEHEGEQEKIVSKCSKFYWKYYWLSFIIENALFFILEIVLIVMYGQRETADSESYLNTGYAACFFVIVLLANGIIRLAWGMIKTFEVCIEDYHIREEEVHSEPDQSPLAQILATKEMADFDEVADEDHQIRKNDRRPSIENRFVP